jgi:hypothetical protein
MEEKGESLYCACEQADFGVVDGRLFVGWDAGKLLRGSAWPKQDHYPVDRAGAISYFLV